MAHIVSASRALNGTALTTLNVGYTEIPVTHISYQDCQAQVRRLQKTDSTWSGGPNFSVVYSDFWFDKVIENNSGLRLYHGATDDQVHESAFPLGSTSWCFRSAFDGRDGNAGFSGPHALDQDNGDAALFMMDKQNQLRAWTVDSTVKLNAAVSTYGNWTQRMSSHHNLNAVLVNHLNAFAASIIAPVVVFGDSSLGYIYGWFSFQERSKVISAVQSYPSGLSRSPWGPTMTVGALDAEFAQPGLR